jgi:ribose 5-phosphate isomerase B
MKLGVGADHGGFEMKEKLARLLKKDGHAVVEFPGFFDPPSARAVANVRFVCGSGIGACVAANKVPGVRAGLCHDDYSARQGVEDDDMNLICFGGRTTGVEVAWECTKKFLCARFTGAKRHRRRLAKIAKLEHRKIAA